MTATDSQTDTAAPSEPEAPAGAPARVLPDALPLLPEDPPRVGDFWLRARLGANAAGYLYTASDEHRPRRGGRDDDRGLGRRRGGPGPVRDRGRRTPPSVVLAHNDGDDDDLALWVALGPIRSDDGSSAAADEREIAERRGEDVLSAVLMDRIPPMGRVRGPDFRHYWENRRRPGLFRIWPLPWPAALRPASWFAITMSLITMAIIMVLAILIAWLLFRNAPEVEPEPVIPSPSDTITITVTPTSPPPSSTGPGTPQPTPTVTTGPRPTGGTPGTASPGTPDPGDRF